MNLLLLIVQMFRDLQALRDEARYLVGVKVRLQAEWGELGRMEQQQIWEGYCPTTGIRQRKVWAQYYEVNTIYWILRLRSDCHRHYRRFISLVNSCFPPSCVFATKASTPWNNLKLPLPSCLLRPDMKSAFARHGLDPRRERPGAVSPRLACNHFSI